MPSDFKRYIFLQDDDSHWFLIPKELVPLFRTMKEEAAATDDWDDFADKFGKFRVSHPSHYVVVGVEAIP